MYVRMHVCRHAFVREVHRCIHTNVRSHTDRCMRFDMNIRTNVRTNGPSNRHTDDCVFIHKMAYSAFIFIKEDFFLSKQTVQTQMKCVCHMHANVYLETRIYIYKCTYFCSNIDIRTYASACIHTYVRTD